MNHPIISPKKLIEVALPLDAINAAAAREKSIRHGHPSTLHLWRARRPLAAARAVIFSQLVNDPEDIWRYQNPGVEANKQVRGHWTKSRARLFKIIEELVLWESTTNEEVLERAREAIRESWKDVCKLNENHPNASDLFDPSQLPPFHDPFSGGGAIPLEAQRLGLETFASDLNPVAVLINKAMIEIPPKFTGLPPVNPQSRQRYPLSTKQWRGAEGLAEDVRYYGDWMRQEAEKSIGHLYPKVVVTKKMAAERPDLESLIGKELTVIAWIWARTVKSPNPAFRGCDIPLVRSFRVCTRPDKSVYVEPVIKNGTYEFKVRMEGEPQLEQTVGRKGALCILSNTPVTLDYVRDEARENRMGARLMAVVVDGPAGRVYLSPTKEIESIAQVALPEDVPHAPIEHWAGCTNCVIYGLESFEKLFSPRQLTAMLCFSDLLPKVAQMVHMDWVAIEKKEAGAMDFEQYSSSLSILLAMAVDKGADYWSTMCTWDNTREGIGHTFGRQAIPMSWDYAETNLFSESSGNWSGILDWVYKALVHLPAKGKGIAIQHDAATPAPFCKAAIISTDPPYYDNVPYSNISDYFYVWLRRGLRTILPELFSTIAVPKQPELVANQFRHGGKANAHKFFMAGMQTAMEHMAKESHPTVPVTIYYAFKQAETKEGATTSTGWETFLEAVIAAGFAVLGTWPMRTELTNRRMGAGNNVLASSVVLVCRPRAVTASTISRREFIRELNVELPLALDSMTRESEDLPSPVAPVDLSQAIIGPGMAVFSKYSAVLEADGTPMTVRTALQLINRFLAEDDFDADTQFCLHWFEQYGWETGKFGEADTLARAKGTSVDGVKNAGVLYSAGGDVRLLKWGEYPNEWDPKSDQRLPIWEVLHQLIRVFNTDGESGAAAVFASVQSKAEAARQLAYRLYTLCERKNWAEDARAYNEVVTSWSGIESAAAKEPAMKQGELF